MRHHDWQQRLTDYLVETAATPYGPGTMDCALWAAGAVKAMTGTDFARGFRGYRTLAGGRKKLLAAGFEDHVALLADRLTEVPPSMAQPGDVAVIETPEGPALGIVAGEMIYVTGEHGRALVPLTDAARAFRV